MRAIGILVVRKIAIALDQPKTTRLLVHEAVDAQLAGLFERSPQPLAGAGLRHEAVAVMHLRAIVIEAEPAESSPYRNIEVSGAIPSFWTARRGYSSAVTCTWVTVPGRTLN